MRHFSDPLPAGIVDPDNDAANAAAHFVGWVDQATGGLGISKWTMITGRIRMAASQADTGPELAANIATLFSGIGDGWNTRNDDLVDALTLVNTPGLVRVLETDQGVGLAVLRWRAAKEHDKTTATKEETPI